MPALRLGWVPLAPVNVALSALVGSPPVQLVPRLKSVVPLFVHVLVAASAEPAKATTIAGTMRNLQKRFCVFMDLFWWG